MKITIQKTKGTALVTVLMVIAVFAIGCLGALAYTSQVAKNVERSNSRRGQLAIADGSLELAFDYWRETCRAKSNISRPGGDFVNVPLPTSTMFPVPGFAAQRTAATNPQSPPTIANYSIVAVDPQFNAVDQTVAPPFGIGMSIESRTTYYKASVDVALPTRGPYETSHFHRIFEKQILSPWNYAIFYVDDLEIHPGPQFTVTGWVHSNSSVYTGHNTLTFANKMTYGNDWNIGFMSTENSHSSETPAAPVYPANQPPTREQGEQPYGLDSTRIFSTTDTNPNNDSYHEILEQRNPAYTDPFTDTTDPSNPQYARYYDQAGVRVLVGTGGALTIKNASDTTITSSSTGNDKLLYTMITGAITTNDSIQDNREGAQVNVTTLDVSKVYTALSTGGPMASTPFNGVIYVSNTTTPASGHRNGVRLKNGAFIPSGGLTVASNNGIYIQGDYNTGTNLLQSPLSNSYVANDPTKPTAGSYVRQPSAVVGDAVMILSNGWQDSNSTKDISLRQATNTTVNTAIISGIVPSGTSNSNYSGGAENFPRFLEDWSNDTLTYYGSMVELYKSAYFTGIWGSNNVYNPPVRHWYFDQSFYINPPPGTLELILYVKGRWYTE